MYTTNARSILMYGAMMVTNAKELANIVEKFLNQYFKKLLYLKYPLPKNLLTRLCVRLRIPSFQMELDRNSFTWITKL